MELTLREVGLTCASCDVTWTDALLVGGYGRLVVRDAAGRHPSVADLMADPLVDLLGAVAAERASLFGRVPSRLSSGAPPDVQAAYLRLCDPSPDGLPWDRDALPACPACGGAPSAHERREDLRRADLPLLTHDGLDALPRDEQRARVAAALLGPVSPPAAS